MSAEIKIKALPSRSTTTSIAYGKGQFPTLNEMELIVETFMTKLMATAVKTKELKRLIRFCRRGEE
jgi:hypothetical protein